MRKVEICFSIFFLLFLAQTVMGQELSPVILLQFTDLSEEPADELITDSLVNRVLEELEILNLTLSGEPRVSYRGNTMSSDDLQVSSFSSGYF